MNNIGIYIINVLNTIRLVNIQCDIKAMALHINGDRIVAGDIDTAEHGSPVIKVLFRCLGF